MYSFLGFLHNSAFCSFVPILLGSQSSPFRPSLRMSHPYKLTDMSFSRSNLCISVIGVGNFGNFNLWSILSYLETRFASLVAGYNADSMDHLKHALSKF